MRVAVPEQVDRDAARKVEITFASLADQIRALTAHRTHSTPGVYGHQRRDRHGRHLSVKSKKATPDGPPLVGPLLYCRGWSRVNTRSEEHTSELQSLMRISYAVFCLKKKKTHIKTI